MVMQGHSPGHSGVTRQSQGGSRYCVYAGQSLHTHAPYINIYGGAFTPPIFSIVVGRNV